MATKQAKKPEEVSQMRFTYEGTEYIMEFDRETVAQTEKMFDISIGDVRDGKISAFEGLFHGSFLKHHPNIKQTTVDRFLTMMPDKQAVFRNLAVMFGNCVNTLLDEPEEGNAISWTAM
jgi:hypothetical protein